MIKEISRSEVWIAQTVDKLTNFLKRVPLLVNLDVREDKSGVEIVIDDLNKKFYFQFDCDMDPKVWIYNIKQELLPYYPRLLEEIREEVVLSPKDMAILIENGTDPSKIPQKENKVTKYIGWRIDKVLTHNDIFLLEMESVCNDPKDNFMDCNFESVEPKKARYKYTGSSVIFLSKARNSHGLDRALSKEFFDRAIFVNETVVKTTA